MILLLQELFSKREPSRVLQRKNLKNLDVLYNQMNPVD